MQGHWRIYAESLESQPTHNLQVELREKRSRLHSIEAELADVQYRANCLETRLLDIMDEMKSRGVDSQYLMAGILTQLDSR